MITEQLICQNKAHHQELLREATRNRVLSGTKPASQLSEALARTGDFLVNIGQGLQQRYRQVESGAFWVASTTSHG